MYSVFVVFLLAGYIARTNTLTILGWITQNITPLTGWDRLLTSKLFGKTWSQRNATHHANTPRHALNYILCRVVYNLRPTHKKYMIICAIMSTPSHPSLPVVQLKAEGSGKLVHIRVHLDLWSPTMILNGNVVSLIHAKKTINGNPWVCSIRTYVRTSTSSLKKYVRIKYCSYVLHTAIITCVDRESFCTS